MVMKKIGLIDAQAIDRSFEIVALTASPENDYDDRAVFRVLMPRLYVMRKNGLSYSRIAKILRQSGLPLSLTAVRTYYCEFLVEMESECVQYAQTTECLPQVAHG
jgi:hypothetical protein